MTILREWGVIAILVIIAAIIVLSGCKHTEIRNEEVKMVYDEDDYDDDDAGDGGSELGAAADADKKGWQTSGTLFVGVDGTVVTLQANFVDDPGPYTIQFGILQPPQTPTGAPLPFSPVATILWSVEGVDVTRVVSLANGLSVSGTAQGVKVLIKDNTDPTISPGLNPPYVVTAQVTRGLRPAENQPPTKVAFQIAAALPNPGDTAVADIPLGAISLSTSYFPNIPPTVAGVNFSKVEMLGPGGIVIKAYDPYVEGSRFVPIPPNATQCRFTNQLPIGIGSMSVQFTFGIDG